MSDTKINEVDKDVIEICLLSGVKVTIQGTPSVENCKSFLNTLLKADIEKCGERE